MVLPKKLIQSITQGKMTFRFPRPFLSRHIPINIPSAEIIAVQYLKAGCVIAVPTDTVYGLACDCTNASAIESLYAVKDRELTKPLAICFGEMKQVEAKAKVDHLPDELLESLLPGPVTVILDNADNNLDKLLTPNGKIAIRLPEDPFITRLACLVGPIALTSANLSNEPTAVVLAGFSSLWDKVPAVFDGGKLQNNDGVSTIVDLSEPGSYRILREGAGLARARNVLKEFNLELAQEPIKLLDDVTER